MAGESRNVLLVLLLAGGAAACVSPGPYRCATAEDCGAGGTCAPAADGSSYCAAADATCPSGQRFGDSAGAQAGVCTGAGRLTGDECFVGRSLDRERSTCVADVCDDLPWCCSASWGPTCVQAAEVRCGAACGGRVAFTRDRLTNADHSQILQDGTVEVWDFEMNAGPLLDATAVPTGIAGPQAYWSVGWTDLERDRTPEMFLGTFDGYVNGDHQRMWRPASPSWELVTDLRLVGAGDQIIDAGFGDFNRDGLVDLVTPIYSGLKVFDGVSTGARFAESARGVSFTPEPDGLIAGLDVGDVDNDGDDDLAYTDYRNPVGRVIINGDDAYTHGAPITIAEVPTDLAFGDADGDADLDVLSADSAGAQLWRNDGGVFTAAWNFPPGPRVSTSYSFAAWIDADGDGDQDVMLATGAPARLHLIENAGGVLADNALWISPIELAGEISTIAVGDVDGDGDLDVAVAGGDDAPSRIWLNDGDRTFTVGWVDGAFRRHRRVAMTARPSLTP